MSRKESVRTVGKRINEKFIAVYSELDKCCSAKFGISAGGVTEYINRLGHARFAPKRDEVLPLLVRYRNIRNIFAHEQRELKKSDEISKSDITWIKKFTKYINKKKDPYSVYLKRARRYARHRRIRRYAIGIAVIAAIAITVALLIYFT